MSDCRDVFRFKYFSVCQDGAPLKVNTDGVLLGALADGTFDRILDVGTGTGLIALISAQKFPGAIVDALEPEPGMYSLAEKNFGLSPFARRIRIFPARLQDFIPETPYDLIVSNPPYFNYHYSNEKNQARNAGNLPLRDLFVFAGKFLSPKGRLAFIFPAGKRFEVLEFAYPVHLFPLSEIDVRDHPDAPVKRTVWFFSRQARRNYAKRTLTLFDPEGRKTPEFDDLTKDSYL